MPKHTKGAAVPIRLTSLYTVAEATAERLGANPPRRICTDTLLNKTANKTKAPLLTSADRHGQVERQVS